MPGSGTSFSKYSMSGSSYFVDVELIQIEKTNCIVLCFLRSLLLNIVWNSGTAQQLMQLSHVAVVGFRTRFSKYSLSGSTVFLEFWVNLCRITDSLSAILSQIIKKFLNIFLNFATLISITTRHTRHCMEIITYHVASFRTRFSKYSLSGSLVFLDFERIQIEKTEFSCAALKTIVQPTR